MNISVILVVHNEERRILRALRSLAKQSMRPSEVIVIDNASTDDTLSAVNKFKEHHSNLNVQVVKRGVNHLGEARSQGVRISRSHLIAFLDGDCEAPTDWLNSLYLSLKEEIQNNPRVVAYGGPQRLPEASRVLKAINLALDTLFGLSGSAQVLRPLSATTVDHLPTGNSIFLKKSLLDVGLFSSDHPHVGEDYEIGLRLVAQDHVLMLGPKPVVINDCANHLGDWLKRMYRFGHNAWVLRSLMPVAKKQVLGFVIALPVILFLWIFLGFIAPAAALSLLVFTLLLIVTSLATAGLKGNLSLGAPLFWVVLGTALSYSLGALVAALDSAGIIPKVLSSPRLSRPNPGAFAGPPKKRVAPAGKRVRAPHVDSSQHPLH